jgi:cell division protein FtsW (lipid II flippase)
MSDRGLAASAARVAAAPFVALVKTLLPTLFTYAVLIGWGWLTFQILDNAPPGKMSGAIVVKSSETPKVLGYLELGQRSTAKSAAAQHLLVARRDGQWMFGNRAQNRRVLLTTTRFDARFVDRWELNEGDRISFPAADIVVAKLARGEIALRELKSGREMSWDGKIAPKGEAVTEVCHGGLRRAINSAKWISREWVTEDKPEIRIFSIGGGVNCSDRWKMAALAPESVFITWQAGKFLVAPGALRDEALLIRKGQTRGHGFADILAPLEGDYGRVESMIVGITRYRVQAAPDQLTLTPLANRVFFFAEEIDPPGRQLLNWIGGGTKAAEWLEARWASFSIALVIAGLIAVVVLWAWFQRRRPFLTLVQAQLAIVPSVLGLALTTMLQQGAADPDRGIIVYVAIAAWFWASFMLVWSGKLRGYPGWLWAVTTLLAAMGMVVLLQLGAGSDNSRWLRFFGNHATVLSLFGWFIAMITVVPDRAWRRLWFAIFTHERWFTLVALLLMGTMMVQFFFGSEEGLFGFQPVELVKMTFVVLLAFVGTHIAESRVREVRAYRSSPLAFLLPYIRVIAIFALIIFAMVAGVRDFSPLIILLTIMIFWLWKVGAWQREFSRARYLWWGIRPLLLLGIAAIAYGAYAVYEDPSLIPESFPKKERIMVWAEPRFHPHTGAQLLGSLDMVGEGGWFGAKAWFGRNGAVMALPEVQNDFVTAFLINRFGGLAGVVLLAAELVFITLMFMLGAALERHFGRGDFREQQLGTVLGFVIYGAGCMYATHWFISWGNTPGLLPIMGQPMTWITSGTSHLIFFAMFALTIALISGWILRDYLEEVEASAMPFKK